MFSSLSASVSTVCGCHLCHLKAVMPGRHMSEATAASVVQQCKRSRASAAHTALRQLTSAWSCRMCLLGCSCWICRVENCSSGSTRTSLVRGVVGTTDMGPWHMTLLWLVDIGIVQLDVTCALIVLWLYGLLMLPRMGLVWVLHSSRPGSLISTRPS